MIKSLCCHEDFGDLFFNSKPDKVLSDTMFTLRLYLLPYICRPMSRANWYGYEEREEEKEGGVEDWNAV